MFPDYNLIPPMMIESIDAWVETARPPGGCLGAILSNDLREAFGRADHNTIAAMFHIVCYLHNKCPAGCWGSADRVSSWAEIGGMAGARSLNQTGERDAD